MPKQKLHGKRIVVTRSVEQASDMCAQLANLGAQPVLIPAIEFVPLATRELSEALAQMAQYDWVLLTSANAVRFFAAALPDGIDLPSMAAVGPATAAAMDSRSLEVSVLPERFTGVELSTMLGNVAGKRFLLPRSRRGDEKIAISLRERGATVDDVAVYDTVTCRPTKAMYAELERGVDVITFTSPSTVESFSEHIPRILWADPVIACIGPTTANKAQNLGVHVHVIPCEYTVAGLIDAIIAHYAN